MTEGDRFGASLPSSTESVSWRSPVEMPRRYSFGSRASRLRVRRTQRGRIAGVNRMWSLALGSPVIPDLGSRHRDGAGSGLHLALGAIPVPNHVLRAIGKLQIRPRGEKGLGLQLHGLRDELWDAGPQHVRQGIIDGFGLTKLHDNAILIPWRIALSGEVLAGLDTRLDTPSFSSGRHPNPSIARGRPRPCVATVPHDALDEGEAPVGLTQQRFPAIAIPRLGGVDTHVQEKAERIDKDATLAPEDRLAHVIAGRIERTPSLNTPLALWASMNTIVRLASRSTASRLWT